MFFNSVGKIGQCKIYESNLFGLGKGITIPEIGIFVGIGVCSKNLDPWLVKHEFGHYLQFNRIGSLKFYIKIGFPSLWSAIKASIFSDYHHSNHEVEIEANQLAFEYFKQPIDWPAKRFSLKKIDASN